MIKRKTFLNRTWIAWTQLALSILMITLAILDIHLNLPYLAIALAFVSGINFCYFIYEGISNNFSNIIDKYQILCENILNNFQKTASQNLKLKMALASAIKRLNE